MFRKSTINFNSKTSLARCSRTYQPVGFPAENKVTRENPEYQAKDNWNEEHYLQLMAATRDRQAAK